MTIIAERIKTLRTNKGLSQRKLAQILDMANSTISGWESDYSLPCIEELKKLSKLFDVSIDYIIGITDIKEPAQLQTSMLKYTDKEKNVLYAVASTGLNPDVIIDLLNNIAKVSKK